MASNQRKKQQQLVINIRSDSKTSVEQLQGISEVSVSLSTEQTLGEFNKDRILVYANELVDELYGRLVRRGYMLRIVGAYLVRTIFSVETREVSFPGLQARRESISSVMIEQLLDRFSFGDSARR
jgi:hypothetical protein